MFSSSADILAGQGNGAYQIYAKDLITDIVTGYLLSGNDDSIFRNASFGYLPIVTFYDDDTFVVNYQNHPYFLFKPFFIEYREALETSYTLNLIQYQNYITRSGRERELQPSTDNWIYVQAKKFVEGIDTAAFNASRTADDNMEQYDSGGSKKKKKKMKT